jgi:hypothetical protein
LRLETNAKLSEIMLTLLRMIETLDKHSKYLDSVLASISSSGMNPSRSSWPVYPGPAREARHENLPN